MTDAPGGRPDEELVTAYVDGDDGAFDELVRRHSERVYGICYRYFGNASDAEDAAQDAFISLMRRAETFQGTARFSTWMYRVAMNACNDLARKRSRRPRTLPLPAEDGAVVPAVDNPSAEDLLASRELGVELDRALRILEPDQREAVVLHDMYGVPYASIAKRTGVAIGTVKSRIHRGHARLAQLLRDGSDRMREPSSPHQPPTVQP